MTEVEMCALEKALVAACNRDRKDRAARHAYIDWLLEQGRDDDAAWVRHDLAVSDVYNRYWSGLSTYTSLLEALRALPQLGHGCAPMWLTYHEPEAFNQGEVSVNTLTDNALTDIYPKKAAD